MSTKLGRQAEQAATEYLVRNSYKIHAQNWRTRYCEIDIVASKNKTIYFVEVKFRSKSGQGSGLEYITPVKIRQMAYAAEFFIAKYRLTNQFILCAISVGPMFEIEDFIELS